MKFRLNKNSLFYRYVHTIEGFSSFLSVLLSLVFILLLPVSCYAENTDTLFAALKDKDYRFFLQADSAAYRDVKKMGLGSAYYIGLHLKRAGYPDAARFYFNQGLALYGEPYKRLCREALYTVGTPEERLKAIDTRLKELKKQNDQSTVAEIPELERKRLAIVLTVKSKSVSRESVERFYLEQPLTGEMAAVFPDAAMRMKPFVRAVTEARVHVFEKRYADAWSLFQRVITEDTLSSVGFALVLSDLGKAALYGAGDKYAAAVFFEALAAKIQADSSCAEHTRRIIGFYMSFYAARLYDRSSTADAVKVAELFQTARSHAFDTNTYDTALWYYLDTVKRTQPDAYLTTLTETVSSWKHDGWYRDLVETLRVQLTAAQNWKKLRLLSDALEQTALNEEKNAAAYILARSDTFDEGERAAVYRKILQTSPVFSYYNTVSAFQLKAKTFSPHRGEKDTTNPHTRFSQYEAEVLVQGLIKFGLYDMIFPRFSAACVVLSWEKAYEYAQMVSDAGLYADSMRILSVNHAYQEKNWNEAALSLLYPRPWLSVVKKYAEEYRIPEYLLYALIRSESFFQSDVVSHAGAIGLTQLMPATAADIAKKLKISEYDLRDPEINIRFGAYYLAEMIRRSNGRVIPACCAYNAGISRVRTWQKALKNVPDDIFLESIEYAETRGYGKKIIAAAAAYGSLYYGKSPMDIYSLFFP